MNPLFHGFTSFFDAHDPTDHGSLILIQITPKECTHKYSQEKKVSGPTCPKSKPMVNQPRVGYSTDISDYLELILKYNIQCTTISIFIPTRKKKQNITIYAVDG